MAKKPEDPNNLQSGGAYGKDPRQHKSAMRDVSGAEKVEKPSTADKLREVSLGYMKRMFGGSKK